MRIALIHAPPWKISAPGEPPDPDGQGPPRGYGAAAMDNLDFLSVPYGLLSVAAQALRAGHRVLVLNLSNFAWRDVERALSGLEAEVFGMTCLTVNRRGVAALTGLIKALRPGAHVTVGGPHVTPLAREVLDRWPGVDSVVLGEGEATFLELVDRIRTKSPLDGLAGAAWRENGAIRVGPARPRIADLDSLAPVHDYFPVDALVTSRGCPGRCTFCASKVMWGGRLKFHSVDAVLDMIEKAVRDHGLRVLAIKDDTFTASRGRALEICRGIGRRGLNFLWSCDTRADMLDEELILAMRLAGCQRISLGVESASREVLENINKRTTPEQVLAVTGLAARYSVEVRYYMMAGNRGETRQTFGQSLEFVRRAGPNYCSYSLLSIFPGTREFELLAESGLGPEVFFEHDFPEFEVFAGRPEDREDIRNHVLARPFERVRRYSAAECGAALALTPGLAAAHMDLAGACCREGRWARGLEHALRAMEAGYPLPEVGLNYLACADAARGDLASARARLDQAAAGYPFDFVIRNRRRLEALLAGRNPEEGPGLDPSFEFATTMSPGQPIMPGPVSVRRPLGPG
ncbi:MAG: radical SAM protein [Desulfovibrionaceae bacterium]|nr:radical SAM protein [Desulfovibrionaceae bacterium]